MDKAIIFTLLDSLLAIVRTIVRVVDEPVPDVTETKEAVRKELDEIANLQNDINRLREGLK